MQANMIVSEAATSWPLLLADFGAAVDLRNGFNFNPEEGLLDPRYAPPELYVVPKDVPRAPPETLALLASPGLWAMHRPDRFDTYAIGMMLLQVLISVTRASLHPGYRVRVTSHTTCQYCEHDAHSHSRVHVYVGIKAVLSPPDTNMMRLLHSRMRQTCWFLSSSCRNFS